MNEIELANARRLFDLLSYIPKERVESEPYETERRIKTKFWTYQFAYTDLKSEYVLIGYLKRNHLVFKRGMRGIIVERITCKQVNDARKKANKTSKQFAINL